MINTSNDAWFGDSFAPHQHLEMTRVRAKEFARPIARATNTGVTGFVDSSGDVLGVTEQFKPNSLRKVLKTNQKVTPFTVIGQNGIGIILTLFLGLTLFLVRKSV
jgi:apolipoprotein N-acyltransferase